MKSEVTTDNGKLHHKYIPTKQGHTISVFYNDDTRLLVVDVNHKNECGGNEVLRKTLDFKTLLRHC